jgi:hypothetical protein
MGFYTVNHSGSTHINEGSEKSPKLRKIKYEKDVPIEDLKKGDLDHVSGAKYHTGEAKDYEPEAEKK